jgi:hypothetical protein
MDSRPNDETLLLRAGAERDMDAFRTLDEHLAGRLAAVGQLSTPVPALRQVI